MQNSKCTIENITQLYVLRWVFTALVLFLRGFCLHTKKTRQAHLVTCFGLTVVFSLALIEAWMITYKNTHCRNQHRCDTANVFPKYFIGAAHFPSILMGFVFVYFMVEEHRSRCETAFWCYFLVQAMSEALEEGGEEPAKDANFFNFSVISPLIVFTLLAYIRAVNVVRSAKLVEDDLCAYNALWEKVPKERLEASKEEGSRCICQQKQAGGADDSQVLVTVEQQIKEWRLWVDDVAGVAEWKSKVRDRDIVGIVWVYIGPFFPVWPRSSLRRWL